MWEPTWVRKLWWWLMEASDILSSVSIEGRILPQSSGHWTKPGCGFSRNCFPSTVTPQPSGNLKQPQIYCLLTVSLLSQDWGFLQRTRFALFWISRLFTNPFKGTHAYHILHHKGDQAQGCKRIRAKLWEWHGAKSRALGVRPCSATYERDQNGLLSLASASSVKWDFLGD